MNTRPAPDRTNNGDFTVLVVFGGTPDPHQIELTKKTDFTDSARIWRDTRPPQDKTDSGDFTDLVQRNTRPQPDRTNPGDFSDVLIVGGTPDVGDFPDVVVVSARGDIPTTHATLLV